MNVKSSGDTIILNLYYVPMYSNKKIYILDLYIKKKTDNSGFEKLFLWNNYNLNVDNETEAQYRKRG